MNEFTELRLVGIKCILCLELIHRARAEPNRVRSYFWPGGSLKRVLQQQLLYQIVHFETKLRNLRHYVRSYHLNQHFQTASIEGWLSRCHFEQQTPKGPEIRSERVNPVILKQLWSHVVRDSLFFFLLQIFATFYCEIRNLFAQSEIAELKSTKLID